MLAERHFLQELRHRRSCRLALFIPVRVSGTAPGGSEFSKDATTLVVNHHGAKLRLTQQLALEQKIHVVSQLNGREAPFRVVSRASEGDGLYTLWGVECLEPGSNIWDIEFPELRPEDQVTARVMLRCPGCRTLHCLHLDEPLLISLLSLGGMMRGCLACRQSGLWSPAPYQQA